MEATSIPLRRRVNLILLLVALDKMQTVYWVGSADLTIEFLVTDADTGEPIKDAEILIRSEGGFYEEREPQELRLQTDLSGVARYVCRRSMSFGTQSGLRFTNTYCVHLPFWFVGITSPGYTSVEPFELDSLPFSRAVKEVGPQQARLVVPVSLRKATQ